MRFKIFTLALHLNNNNLNNNDTKLKLADFAFDVINQILIPAFKYISYLISAMYPLVTFFSCDLSNMRGEHNVKESQICW